MRRATSLLTLAGAALASLATAPAANATPSIQILNTVPTGPTPGLQTPMSLVAVGAPTAVSYDSDPTLPWLIDVQNQFTKGTATSSRIGAAGFTPTTPLSPVDFYADGEAHPYSVIVGANDSYVYRIDSLTGECVWKTYIGRTTAQTIHFPGCSGGVPTEQIQCPNEAGGTVVFPGYFSPTGVAAETTVFIPTSYDEVSSGDDPDDCGTTSDNRVYALNGATGAPQWVFNSDPTSATPYAIDDSPLHAVNGVVGTPDLDVYDDECSGPGVSHTQIIFGTIDPGTGQDTLFSVSTAPATPGALNWSMASAGDIRSGLLQSWGQASTCQHLYASTSADGLFETIGLTSTACKGAAAPCFLSKQQIFLFSPPLGDVVMFTQQSSPLFGKLVVATESTIYVLTDTTAPSPIYCTAATVQAHFPVLTGAPSPLTNSVWFGANDTSGNGAIVGLEVPSKPPSAPYDCGSAFTAARQAGTVGAVSFDFNPTTNGATAVLYTAVNTPNGGEAVTASFTE